MRYELTIEMADWSEAVTNRQIRDELAHAGMLRDRLLARAGAVPHTRATLAAENASLTARLAAVQADIITLQGV